MGDFERIFGAGADIDAIIASFGPGDDYYDHINDTEPVRHRTWDLPQARTSYDTFGEVWRPASTPYDRISDRDLADMDIAAKETLAAIKADPMFDPMDIMYGEPDAGVGAFLSHLRLGLSKVGATSLDRFEAFVGMVVRGSEIEIVFARDSGPEAGYVSPTLTSHILAFPNDTYILRISGLELEGPLWNLGKVGGDYSPGTDSYEAFASPGPGREVLEVSRALLNPEKEIIDATDWVKHTRERNANAEADHYPYPGFDTVAHYVASKEPRSRTWSDTAEDELKQRVGRIISALIYPGETVTVRINPTPSGSSLSCQVDNERTDVWRKDGKDVIGFLSARDLIDQILSLLPLPGFRGKSPGYELLEITCHSPQDRIRGAGYLLDFLNEAGIDTSAAADAILAEDRFRLYQIISPEVEAEKDCIPF
ncbi:hypothetical protein [Paracoccus pantotrophus]|uniref:hypothetical protein n=1 Tax=Paracoccus pantotrophus TaxID=82367 RepID=UPI00048F714E|nr:hypothetical protein [Paracoccus pantotrophus]